MTLKNLNEEDDVELEDNNEMPESEDDEDDDNETFVPDAPETPDEEFTEEEI